MVKRVKRVRVKRVRRVKGVNQEGQDLDLDLICISTVYEDMSLDLRQI